MSTIAELLELAARRHRAKSTIDDGRVRHFFEAIYGDNLSGFTEQKSLAVFVRLISYHLECEENHDKP